MSPSLTLRSEPILEGFVRSHQSKPVLISSPTCTNRLIFGEGPFFIFLFLNMLSEYANQSHNFTNLNFRDVTLQINQSILFKLDSVRSGCPISRARGSCIKRSSIPDRIGIQKCWFLRRGENRSTRRKTSRSREENQQQTQPTYDVESANRTRATVVEGECSHHCAIPAPPLFSIEVITCCFSIYHCRRSRPSKKKLIENNSYLPRQANDPGVLSQNFPFSQIVEFSEHSSTSEISCEQVKFYVDRERSSFFSQTHARPAKQLAIYCDSKDSQSRFYGFSFVFIKNSLVPLFLLTLKNINNKHYWLKFMVA